ncbi:MAG: GIY-YIG nuclease family protein [Calditrichia bacterium]|nr:GIY-YIG nuclease family protein [Calditrichia bacterium]
MTKPAWNYIKNLPLGNIRKGCYQLDLRLDQSVSLQVGSLCRLDLAKGHYIYTGRHKKSLASRIRRHLQPDKTVYWHIDYFTTHPAFSMENIIIYPEIETECLINQGFHRFFDSIYLFPGLGSGDCLNGCRSHMQYMKNLSGKLLSEWIELHSALNPVILSMSEFKDRTIYA